MGEIEIGWRLGRAYWGKGYVTAAAAPPWSGCGQRGSGWCTRWSTPDNERSIAVTQRLGMDLAETFVLPRSEERGHRYLLEL